MFSLRKISVILFFVSLSQAASCGNPYYSSAGAGEAGMGYVCIMRTGFWSSFRNQALLAYNRSFAAGINYENRFYIPELGTCTAGIICPAGKCSMGFMYSNFGYPEFRRNTAGISCGLKLSGNIAAGIQIDYFSEVIPGNYDNISILTFETGMIFKASEKITTGFHLFNPVPNSIRKSFLPSTIIAGAGIDLSKTLFAGAEAEMSSGEKLIIRTGFEYEAVKKLWIRSGFNSDNSSFSFGIGYLIKSVKIDMGFATHMRLGVSSSASIVYSIK